MATNTPQPTFGERLLALGGNPRDLDSVRVQIGTPANGAWSTPVPVRIGAGDAVLDAALVFDPLPARSAPLIDNALLRRFFLREGARYYASRALRPSDAALRVAWSSNPLAVYPRLADPWLALPRVLSGLLGGVAPYSPLYRELYHEARRYRLGDSSNFYDLVMEPLLRDAAARP